MASPTAQLVSQRVAARLFRDVDDVVPFFFFFLLLPSPFTSMAVYVTSLNGATTLKSRAAYHKGIMSCLTFDRLHW